MRNPVSEDQQERLPRGHRGQHAELALFAELVLDPAQTGNQAHHAFREMGVEIVADHLPACGRRGRREQGLQEAGVVLLGAPVADDAVHLAGSDIEGRDHALCAVADVFELVTRDIARPHRQVRGGALKRLHAGHFVDRHRANVLLRCRDGLLVDRADIGAFRVELGIGRGRQPAAHAMRLEISTL